MQGSWFKPRQPVKRYRYHEISHTTPLNLLELFVYINNLDLSKNKVIY